MERVSVHNDGSITIAVHAPRLRRFAYHVLQTYDKRAIWVFSSLHQSAAQYKWVIAFRGTQVLDDIVSDSRLMRAVATGNLTKINRVIEEVRSLLFNHILREHNITKGDSILLLGHSLGATLAEAMLLFLRRDGYRDVHAIGYDTPGLPNEFRAKFPGTQRNNVNVRRSGDAGQLTLVYAHDNLINNLTAAPQEALCFHVGEGDPFRGFFSGMYSFFCHTSKTHSLDAMIALIESGHIQRDTSVARRQWSGNVLRFVYGAFCGLCEVPLLFFGGGQQHGGVSGNTRRFDFNVRYRTQETEARVTADRDGLYPCFPNTVEEAVDKYKRDRGDAEIPRSPTPYRVRDVGRFVRILDEKCDVVCPLIGLTSVGKTSLLKAVFDLHPSNRLLQVGPEMDVTREQYVMLWRIVLSDGNEVRLWLMDFPGVHGSQQGSEFSEESVYIKNQLQMMRLVIQSACFVVASNPTDHNRALFRETVSVLGDRVFVVHNVMMMCDNEGMQRLKRETKEAYERVMVEETGDMGRTLPVVMTRVLRGRGETEGYRNREEGIADLRNELCRWLQDRVDDIANERRKAIAEDLNAGVENKVANAMSYVRPAAAAVALLPAAAELIATGSLLIAGMAAVGPLAAATAVTCAIGGAMRHVLRPEAQR